MDFSYIYFLPIWREQRLIILIKLKWLIQVVIPDKHFNSVTSGLFSFERYSWIICGYISLYKYSYGLCLPAVYPYKLYNFCCFVPPYYTSKMPLNLYLLFESSGLNLSVHGKFFMWIESILSCILYNTIVNSMCSP